MNSEFKSMEPATFREYLGQANTGITVQDATGNLVSSRKVVEPMQGDFAVRVLIPAGTTKTDALRLLKKIITFVEVSGTDPESIDDGDFV